MTKKILSFILISIIILGVMNLKNIMVYLYPKHYEVIVEKYSNEYNLDPFLIYSLIKTESKFNPYAKSHKGALGLMQITPKTGSYIAGLLKERNFADDMLYNTEVNIKFGCYYLTKLSQDFNNDIDSILAAYNGGEGNVRKWIKTDSSGEKYLNIEDIPFKETRLYVKKVKKDYKIYSWIYSK